MMHPTNPTGYFNIPEPALDEPENWRFDFPEEPFEEEYDRAEDELNGKFDRR